MSRSTVIKPIVLLVLTLVAINSLVFFGGRTRVPLAPTLGTTGLASMMPYGYAGPVPSNTIEVDMGGAFNASYAYDRYLAASLREGTVPLWDPNLGLGFPHLGNGLSGVLYPLNWLHAAIPAPYHDVVYFLNWALGAFFLYLYVRRLGFRQPEALLAGIAFLSSGWFQGWLALREVTAVAAWFPLLLYAVERILHDPNWRCGHLVLAAGVYCTITAGHPEAFIPSLMFFAAYGLLRLRTAGTERRKPLATLTIGSIGGLFLAAPMWLSFIDAASYSINPHHDYEPRAGHMVLPGYEFASYWLPHVFGVMHDAETAALRDFAEIELRRFAEIGAAGWLPPVLGFFAVAGVMSLRRRMEPVPLFFTATFLLVAAKIWGMPVVQLIGSPPILNEIIWPRYGAFLLIVAVAVLAAQGARDLRRSAAQEWRPALVAWMIVVLALGAVAALQIFGAHDGVSGAARRRSVQFLLLGVGWATLPPLIMGWGQLRRTGHERLPFVIALATILPAVAYGTGGFNAAGYIFLSAVYLVLFVLASALLISSRRFTSFPALGIIAACAIVPVNIFAQTSRSGLPARQDALALPPYLVKLKTLQQGGLYRSFSFDAAPMPNLQTALGIPGMSWIVPLVPDTSREFTKRFLDRTIRKPNWYAGNVTVWPDAVPHGALKELSHNLRFFSLAGVRYVVAQGTSLAAAGLGLEKTLPLVYEDTSTGVKIFENRRAMPRLFLAPRVVTVQTQEQAWDELRNIEALNVEVIAEASELLPSALPLGGSTGSLSRFEVAANEVRAEFRANGPGMLVLTDLMVPGWHVEVNGTTSPLYRINGTFRGVLLPGAGDYSVRFWYRPRYWTVALLLALVGGFAVIVACAAHLHGRRSTV